MDHFPTVGHLKCTVKAVYIKSFEAKRGVRANPLEPPLPTGLVCVCETSSVGLGKLFRNNLMDTSLDRNNLPGPICQHPHPTEDSGGI